MIDINSDLGESFGAYSIGLDEQVIAQISSANVACGWHAGDPLVMERTVEMAKRYGVAVGAHPGYPDLVGFGRREMRISPAEANAYVKYQVGALLAFTMAAGVKLQHVKPHGALYNMACKDAALADAICSGVAAISRELIILAPAGSQLINAAIGRGLPVANEVFADRAYQDDGTLAPRNVPGAVITDEALALARVIRMVRDGVVETLSGGVIPVNAQSVCVHGDNPKAAAFAMRIRSALTQQGIEIAPIGKFAVSAQR